MLQHRTFNLVSFNVYRDHSGPHYLTKESVWRRQCFEHDFPPDAKEASPPGGFRGMGQVGSSNDGERPVHQKFPPRPRRTNQPLPMRFELTRLFWWTALVAILFGAIRLAFAVPGTAVTLAILGGSLGLTRLGWGSTRVVLGSAAAMGLLGLLAMVFAYQTQEFPVIDFYDNFIGYPLLFAAAGAVVGLVATWLLTIRDAVIRRFDGEREDI